MENVMLNGFNADEVSDGSQWTIKLGDLGTAMYPARGTAQPIAYRAPEVYFREEITQAGMYKTRPTNSVAYTHYGCSSRIATLPMLPKLILSADIWAVGLIYSHLLEAQSHFSESSLYDDLYFGTNIDERARWIRHAIANDYNLHNEPYYHGSTLPIRDENHEEGNHWAKLRKRGLEELDVEFLKRILKADPTTRPSSRAILESQWLAGGLLARRFAQLQVDGTR